MPFLGPQTLYAVALFKESVLEVDENSTVDTEWIKHQVRQQNLVFAQLESTMASPESALASLETIYSTLLSKLGDDVSVLSHLTNTPELAGHVLGTRALIALPQEAFSRDHTVALALVEMLSAQKLERLELEYAFVPWRSSQAQEHLEFIQKRGSLGLYHEANSQVAQAVAEFTRRKKMLLHVCCGPDAAGVINQLKRDYDVTCFWYDPNIQPVEEYQKRLDAFLKVADIEKVPVIVGEYDVDHFFERIEGLEHTPEQGAKCSHCYDMRLERSAVEARDKGFDFYSTTLAISPHKVQEKLKNFGTLNEKKYGVPYYAKNFMKDDGFKLSVEYTRDYNIYRQDYCGCYFSLFEGGKDAQAKAQALGLSKSDLKPGYKNPFKNTSSTQLNAKGDRS